MYLKKTESLRGSESQLLISHVKPFKKVVSSSISRWLLNILKQAGVNTDVFKAHSTRGAATSASVRLGASMRDVLTTAGWSSASTFSSFYHRPSAHSVVAKTLLGGASKSPIDWTGGR